MKTSRLFSMIAMALILCTFIGCTTYTPPAETEAARPTNLPKSTSIPLTNMHQCAYPTGGGCPSSTSNGYYSGSMVLRYYDFGTKSRMTMCSQPGCTHSDNSCNAWLGKNCSYLEYQGNLYATVENEADSSVQLICRNIQDNTVRVLDSWKNDEKNLYSASILCLSYPKMTVYTEQTSFEFLEVEDGYDQKYVSRLFVYDLDSGEKITFLPDVPFEQYRFYGFYDNHALVQYCMAEPEQLTLIPEAENYIPKRELPYELRLYDMSDWSYDVIVSTEKDDYQPLENYRNIYGTMTAYKLGNDLYSYDLASGQATKLAMAKNILDYFVMDGNLFYTIKENDEYTFWHVPLSGGTPVMFQNNGNKKFREFTPYWEGNGFFWGHRSGGDCVISKEDFYAEHYENAVPAA